VPIVLVPAIIVLLIVVLIPISIVQRFRRGAARRRARGWVVTLNVLGICLSVVMVLLGSLITSAWVPRAAIYTLAGLGGGALLGLLGLAMTRWDVRGGRLEFTPSRWLVLGLTLVVSARVLYGFWRTWNAVSSADVMTTAAVDGLAASMSAGAVVLGYYFVYWIGVRAKMRRLA
jgi:hypothetical protein